MMFDSSLFQVAKMWLVDHTGLAKDALHVHFGLMLFFASALLARWPIRSWKPWLVVLVITLAGEALDMRNTLNSGGTVILGANWQDVWNTMLWPTILSLLAWATTLSIHRRPFPRPGDS